MPGSLFPATGNDAGCGRSHHQRVRNSFATDSPEVGRRCAGGGCSPGIRLHVSRFRCRAHWFSVDRGFGGDPCGRDLRSSRPEFPESGRRHVSSRADCQAASFKDDVSRLPSSRSGFHSSDCASLPDRGFRGVHPAGAISSRPALCDRFLDRPKVVLGDPFRSEMD